LTEILCFVQPAEKSKKPEGDKPAKARAAVARHPVPSIVVGDKGLAGDIEGKCSSFLGSQIFIPRGDYDRVSLHLRQALGALNHPDAPFIAALMDEQQLQLFSQVGYLQEQICKYFVEKLGFPSDFELRSEIVCAPHFRAYLVCLPKGELQSLLEEIAHDASTLFDLNMTLIESSSILFLVSVQLLSIVRDQIPEPEQSIPTDTAKLLAHDLVKLSNHVRKLIRLAKLLKMTDSMDQRLLELSPLPQNLLALIDGTETPRNSYVKSHRLRINSLVTTFISCSHLLTTTI
jgi:hypothetical protein